MLIVKLVMLVLVFALTSSLNAIQYYATGGTSLSETATAPEIVITAKNGAAATYEIVDEKIVFDITKSGESYDDVSVQLIYKNIEYDSAFIRERLGKSANGKNADFVKEMEEGPWHGYFSYMLSGEDYFTTDMDARYTITAESEGGDAIVERVASSGANTREKTEGFETKKKDTKTFTLIFGNENSGALSEGKYSLEIDLRLEHPEGKKANVNVYETVAIIVGFGINAIKESGFKIFSVTNWIGFYAMLMICGWFVYLWRDARIVLKVFITANPMESFVIVKEVVVNGFVTDRYEDRDDSGIAKAIIMAGLAWVVLTVTIPLRILWYIIRDIIYLFKEDEEMESFSYTGNIMGSVGIHILLFSISALFSGSTVPGVIALVLGLGLCIAAHFLCRSTEI